MSEPSCMGAEFIGFGKIARLNTNVVLTEKIDGSNGQLFITEDKYLYVGSRKKWLGPGKNTDNHGFAAWARSHESELIDILGPGRHFGEWWGSGIQRKYDMEYKVFSLFNTKKWEGMLLLDGTLRVVPVLETTTFDTASIRACQTLLGATGSQASPGFMNPEGVMVYHPASNNMFKAPFDKLHKGEKNA